jgi:hypothetical protein
MILIGLSGNSAAAGPMAAKTANRPTSAALMRMTFPPNDLKLPKGTLA